MADNQLIPMGDRGSIQRPTLARIGTVARMVARQHALKMYHSTLTANTLKRHRGDLDVFSKYLKDAGEEIDADALMFDLSTWAGATEGLLQGFKEWMLNEGFSIGSVNVRLATVKKYCEVAAHSGFLDAADLGLIKGVYGYRGKEGRNVDEKRATTRVGNKKATPTSITVEQAHLLLDQQDSRDALLMYLLLRLGFRVGEVAGLEVSNVDLSTGYIRVYRQKTHIEQTHELRWSGLELFRRYLEEYNPQGKLFTGKLKVDTVTGASNADYTIRAIQKRVQVLGRQIGLEQLSPHDCRHYFATRMAREKTHIKAMQDAGGWKTPYMPLRYAESSAIANEGVVQ